jgi:hypothetical protein
MFKVVPYTSSKIWSARLIFYFFLAVCLNISTVINIKILANSNQQTQGYKFTSHIAAFLSVVFITEMLEICLQTSYDQNVQLILKSYLPVTDFKELSPCSVWYPLKLYILKIRMTNFHVQCYFTMLFAQLSIVYLHRQLIPQYNLHLRTLKMYSLYSA